MAVCGWSKRIFFLLVLSFSTVVLAEPASIHVDGCCSLTPQGYSVFFRAGSSNVVDPYSFVRQESLMVEGDLKKALGYRDGTMAVKMILENRSKRPIEYYLNYKYPSMQRIDLYSYRDGQLVGHSKSGKLRSITERTIQNKAYVFPVKMGPLEHVELILLLRTMGSFQIPIQLLTPQDFLKQTNSEYLWFGLYYGLTTLILFYSLFVFLSTREQNYLYYSAYITLVALTQASLHGIAFQYLWPSHIEWNKISTLVLVGWTFFSLFLLTANFLETRKNVPWLHRAMSVYGFTSLLLSGLSFYFYGTALIKFAGLLVILFPFVFVTIGVVCSLKGVRGALFFLVAIVLYSFGVGSYGLKDMGVIPSNLWTEYGIVIGSAVEILLIIFGLGKKMEYLQVASQQASHERTRYQAIADASTMVAHDLKGPYFETLSFVKNSRIQPAQKQNITLALERMGFMIEAFRDPEGEMKVKKCVGQLTIGELISEAFPYNAKNIFVEASGAIEVHCDLNKIERVIINLVKNALEAKASNVRVFSRVIENDLQLTVEDNGKGIPEDLKDKVFDRGLSFGKPEGSGLGLWYCRAIALGHGGNLEYSRAAGISQFQLSLPGVRTNKTQQKNCESKSRNFVSPSGAEHSSPIKLQACLAISDRKKLTETKRGLKGIPVSTDLRDFVDSAVVVADVGSTSLPNRKRALQYLVVGEKTTSEELVKDIKEHYLAAKYKLHSLKIPYVEVQR